MATCKLVLDKRVKLKDEEYNLSIRVIDGKNQLYLKISKMTELQYSILFNPKNFQNEAVEFRETCNKHVTRCQRILSEMKIFSRDEIKRKFTENKQDEPLITDSLRIDDLFTRYTAEKLHLSIGSLNHMKHSKNVLLKDNSELTILDIDSQFLTDLHKKRLSMGVTISAINSNMRDLRTVINYFSKYNKIVPTDYSSPFSYNGYKICDFTPQKSVMSNKELKTLLDFKDFGSKEEEYARDIWELLYRLNGINFADLLRLRWDNKKGEYFSFFRKKTENTRKNFKKEIIVPIDIKIENLINKVGNRESDFVLGKLKNGYSETTFSNLNGKMRKLLNGELKTISNKLNLSVLLQLKTARDTYATVLKRSNKISVDSISEMLAHANPNTTKNYLASMDIESLREVNKHLI